MPVNAGRLRKRKDAGGKLETLMIHFRAVLVGYNG